MEVVYETLYRRASTKLAFRMLDRSATIADVTLGRANSLHETDLILEVAYGQKTYGMHVNGHTPWAHKVVGPEARSYPHVRRAYHGR